MKTIKPGMNAILMISSIVLLLIFQLLWLSSAWHRAYDGLRKETTMAFRTTVFALHDSVLQRNIVAVPGDSLAPRLFRFHPNDSTPFDEPDTLIRRPHFREEFTRLQVIVSPNENDSARQAIKPMISRFFRDRSDRGQGNFILRLRGDSLNLDSLSLHFQNALTASAIHLPFQVSHFRRGDKTPSAAGMLMTDPVRINPLTRYVATFSHYEGYLFRQIIPQILFSVFLTLLTTGSFYVLYRSLSAQRKMAELKNDFISNVTHELKTPITTVGVALEALRSFKVLENTKLTHEYLDIAQNELNRLTILTDKVLKTAIFEKNGVSFPFEKVDLEKTLEQILGSLKLVLEKLNAEVSVVKDGKDFVVDGGADHLTNILYNLIDNALKYSLGQPHITLTLREQPEQVMISVADQGLGIAAEYHRKIFEKFFRIPTGDIHTIKGYGLGLSYVALVVRQHRGTITVNSEPGKGSTFVVTLPKHEKN